MVELCVLVVRDYGADWTWVRLLCLDPKEREELEAFMNESKEAEVIQSFELEVIPSGPETLQEFMKNLGSDLRRQIDEHEKEFEDV